MNADRQKAVEALQARRKARGMNDPHNRLSCHIDKAIENGADIVEEHPLITQAKARRTKLTFIVPDRDDVFTVWPKDDADRAKLIASAEAQGWKLATERNVAQGWRQ